MGQKEVLQGKQEEVLARRLELREYDQKAIALGIELLGRSEAISNCRLPLEALVSRAASNGLVEDWMCRPRCTDLPRRALKALVKEAANPLLLAVAMNEATTSRWGPRAVATRVMEPLGISLPKEAEPIWEAICSDQRPGWETIARSLNLTGYRHMPGSPDIWLYDHSRRVMVDPTVESVGRLASDCATMPEKILRGMPVLRTAIVRAALWGNRTAALMTTLRARFPLFWREIVTLLATSQHPREKRGWKPKDRVKLVSAQDLTRLFMAELSKLEPEEQNQASQAILKEGGECEWLWDLSIDLLTGLPSLTGAVDFIQTWDNKRDAGERKGVKPCQAVAVLPPAVATSLAAIYVKLHGKYRFEKYGFPALVRKHPAEYVAALRPIIETGNANALALACVLEVADEGDARAMLCAWLANDSHPMGSPFSEREGDARLVAQMKRFGFCAAGTRLYSHDRMIDLMHAGYELQPEDVANEEKMQDVVIRRNKVEGVLKHTGILWWENPASRQVLLHCGHSETEVLLSFLASLTWVTPKGRQSQEWFEEVIIPELLSQPRLMRAFCEIAWRQLGHDGTIHARRILIKEGRIQNWMTPAEREYIPLFIQFNRARLVGSEIDIAQALLSEDDQVSLLLDERNIANDGGLPQPDPWVQLFCHPDRKRRLVGFLTLHMASINQYAFMAWVRAFGLEGNPAILRQANALLDGVDVPRAAIELVRASATTV